MKKLNEYNLAFIDLESSGLDEYKHEIIEIAALVYNPEEDKIIEEWETKIAPLHIETANQEALKINGYTNNPNLYTTNLNSALIKFNSIVSDCMLINQNVDFDLRFIYKNMSDLGIKPSWQRRAKLDLASLAWFAIRNGEPLNMSLASLCDRFNISNAGAHGALIDCHRAFAVYRSLENIYGKNLIY